MLFSLLEDNICSQQYFEEAYINGNPSASVERVERT